MAQANGTPDPEGEAAGPEQDALLFAAADLGSNSFHMIVGRFIDGQLSVVDRLRDPVRLQAGLQADRSLDEETLERALMSLERMGERIRGLHPDRVRAIGTNTFRRARGARSLLQRAGAALGFPIEILSGREEARLIHYGVSHQLPPIDGRRLVVDIGGGSTEVVLGQGFRARVLDSIAIGCVAHTRRFFGDGELTRERFKAAETAARLELEGVSPRYSRRGWEQVIGCSGTIKSVALYLEGSGLTDGEITPEGLGRLRKAMIAAGSVSALDLGDIPRDRVEVLAGGLSILRAVFQEFEVGSMRAEKAALREGVLYDLYGRTTQEDVRDRTIRSLGGRYHVDAAQAERVAACALALLEQVAEDWQLEDGPCAQLLEWAARLHEVGMSISFSGHHKHGAYLVQHADMPGFSRQAQANLSALVRSHRRRFPSHLFAELVPPWDERCAHLALLLRLAVRLNRSRRDAGLPPMRLRVVKRGLELALPAEWLEEHPLTRADLEDEAEVLKGADIALTIRTDG